MIFSSIMKVLQCAAATLSKNLSSFSSVVNMCFSATKQLWLLLLQT